MDGTVASTWQDAVDSCEAMGRKLAVPNKYYEAVAIQSGLAIFKWILIFTDSDTYLENKAFP